MSEFSQRIMERIAGSLDDETFIKLFSPDGLASTRQWHCEDDWLVQWTTEPVRGGKYDGYFLVMLFKPVGKGSRAQRKGSASEWQRVKIERCKTRSECKQRREHHYWEHNPTRAAKCGKATATS